MKARSFAVKTAPLLLIALGALYSATAQQSKKDKQAEKEASVQNMIVTQDYVFKAQSVLPMRGRVRQLTSDYDMKVSKDSVTAYLPYFGRAYTAPDNLTGGGIEFQSKDFGYSVQQGKKGGWNISIKPKDVKDIRQVSLSVSANGYASLQVISTSRQPISFNGYIKQKE